MSYFHYRDREFYVEDIPVKTIVAETGTPVYIYSQKAIFDQIKKYEEAFSKINHITCYALKANSNSSVINLVAQNGLGGDIVSGGELYRALKGGIPANKIVYSGVGKTDTEIAYALAEGILMFNCESTQELNQINTIAQKMGKKAPVALRVNPDINANTHPYISTGLKKNKFGISIEKAKSEYSRAKGLDFIEVKGVHFHIGSQIIELSPFSEAFDRIGRFVKELQDNDISIQYLDIGGGLGISYKDERPPEVSDLASLIAPLAKEIGCCIISEPGRMIVGNAGTLVTRVLYLKDNSEKRFIIVDAAMNDLIRPSIYSAYHEIVPVLHRDTNEVAYNYDIVGPICESGDFLAKDRLLSPPKVNDLLAVMSAGAYGFSMSSNYNSRPRPSEVMASGDTFTIIRGRETYEDLIRLER
ncbi:MAG: diaminopimelate decarboxylase [bacterium]